MESLKKRLTKKKKNSKSSILQLNITPKKYIYICPYVYLNDHV